MCVRVCVAPHPTPLPTVIVRHVSTKHDLSHAHNTRLVYAHKIRFGA